MAIARPVTKTIISTTGFGIPVVDGINNLFRYGKCGTVNGTAIATSVEVPIGWNTGTYRGEGVTVSSTAWTFPTAGTYEIMGTWLFYVAGGAGSYMGVNLKMLGGNYIQAVTGYTGAWCTVNMMGALTVAAGAVVTFIASTDMPSSTLDGRSVCIARYIGV